MKKTLIIGIIFLIISFSLTIYSQFINKSVNMYSITNSGKKDINKKAFIDATFIGGTITGDNKLGFYVVFGNGVQYIVYMKNSLASKINQFLLDNPDQSYRINGVTKLIPNQMEENGKKFVKEWLDHAHNHEEIDESHSHDISNDDFYHYFGYIYLDSTSLDIINIVIYLTGIIGVVLIINTINKKYKIL